MKLLKIVGKFLSFLLTIVFFGIFFSFVTILIVKNTIREESIYKHVTRINILDVKTNDIVNKKDASIKQILKEELEKYSVPENLFQEVLDQKKIERLMAQYSVEYANYVLFNKDKPVLLESDIYNIINIEKIESYGNRILINSEKQSYQKFVSSLVKTINNNMPDKEQVLVKENVPYLVEILDFIYADNFNMIMIANLVFILILIAIFTWSLYKPFGFIGLPIVITGGIYIISYLVQIICLKHFISDGGTIENLIKDIIHSISIDVLIYGIIILTSGIIMLIIYSLISQAIKRKQFRIAEEQFNKKIKEKEIENI